MAAPGPPRRIRVREGEEARLVAGVPAAAELWSRGSLPLRTRSEPRHHGRPAFPGTAVVIGEDTFEVMSRMDLPEDGLVLYRLRAWPDGEAVRDRVVYGADLVRVAEEERERARLRARVHPWRFFLYPLVGALPEERQERVCERLGLYSVTATLASGLCESLGVLAVIVLLARGADEGKAIALVVMAPGLMLFVIPGLSRAAGALLFRQAAGAPLADLVGRAVRAPRRARASDDPTFVPLTRRAFWERLDAADAVESAEGGPFVFHSVLPHVTWTPARKLQAGSDFWGVRPEPPRLRGRRLVYSYRVEPLANGGEGDGPAPRPPSPRAYADEVLAGVRRDWDDLNRGFAWLTALLASEVQARAFAHRGGPAAAARPTRITAAVGGLLGLYLLGFVAGGPAADPLAPFVVVMALLLLADGVRRYLASTKGRYAPSLFRFLVPAHLLRPERRAYGEHRRVERATRSALARA